MAHLSVENVLIFLWHCYVEVFDFSLPLPLLSLSLPLPPPSPSPSFFLHHLFIFPTHRGTLLRCNSLFECIQIQGKAAGTSFFREV